MTTEEMEESLELIKEAESLLQGIGLMKQKYDYKKSDRIGSGAFGNVYLGINKETNERVAIKRQRVSENSIDNVYGELVSLNKIRLMDHSNVLLFYEAFVGGDFVYFVLELIENGSTLVDLFTDEEEYPTMRNKTMTESDIRHIIYQCIDALQQVFVRYQICHRDVKFDNILVKDWNSLHIVLTDFNHSKTLKSHFDNNMKTEVGTVTYCAPEVLKAQEYNYKIDIWSVGVLMFYMLSWGSYPYSNGPVTNAYKYEESFIDMPNETVLQFNDREQFDNVSDRAKVVLRGMLRIDPEVRFVYSKIKALLKPENYPENDFDLNKFSRKGGLDI